MARSVKPATAKQPPAPARKPIRPTAAPAKPAAKATKPSAAPKRAAAAAAPAMPAAAKVSKDELRAQVEKLERANATLRAKGRETNKAAKAATTRIAELEQQVTQFEKQAAAVKADKKPARPSGASRKSRGIDPGDAVPPGVAVQEPEPLDNEAKTALGNLEEHLGHE